MSHQPSVSAKFYQATCGSQDAARAYYAMDGLMKGVRGQQFIPSAGNTKWTDAETKIIKAIFATCINNKETPSLNECSKLEEKFKRSKKKIQDKVRTLIRNSH